MAGVIPVLPGLSNVAVDPSAASMKGYNRPPIAKRTEPTVEHVGFRQLEGLSVIEDDWVDIKLLGHRGSLEPNSRLAYRRHPHR